MENQPLSSSDQSKILIFCLLLAPSVVFLVGAIPALFLGFGLFMMKKNEDFSHVETAVRNFTGYASLVLAGCLMAVFYFGRTYGKPDYTSSYGSWYNEDVFIASWIFAAISIVYLVLVKVLFLKPLKYHCKWVEVNGILSSKPKSAKRSNFETEVDIIKGEKLKQYSVADELIKWAKLKDDGHITEDEFREARTKLLKRN